MAARRSAVSSHLRIALLPSHTSPHTPLRTHLSAHTSLQTPRTPAAPLTALPSLSAQTGGSPRRAAACAATRPRGAGPMSSSSPAAAHQQLELNSSAATRPRGRCTCSHLSRCPSSLRTQLVSVPGAGSPTRRRCPRTSSRRTAAATRTDARGRVGHAGHRHVSCRVDALAARGTERGRAK